MFINPQNRTLFTEWDKVGQWIVAQFRLSCSQYTSDQWFENFVKELMIESDDFKKWWLDHNVNFEEDFRKHLMIESVGELVFDFTSFDVSSNPQIKIAVHTPANSETSYKLKMLLTN